MRERVVVKWGGGLITKKHEMKTVRTDVLDDLARQLEACLDEGVDVVLVHGAGSFGHLKAKAYRLAEGKVNDGNLPSEMTQEEAVADVRSQRRHTITGSAGGTLRPLRTPMRKAATRSKTA